MVPRSYSFKPSMRTFDVDISVSELLGIDKGWDMEVLAHCFLPVDVQIFLFIQVGFADREDILL